MGHGEHDLRVDEGAAALVDVLLFAVDEARVEHGRHPRELAELRLVVAEVGDADVQAVLVADAADGIVGRRRRYGRRSHPAGPGCRTDAAWNGHRSGADAAWNGRRSGAARCRSDSRLGTGWWWNWNCRRGRTEICC